MKNLVIKWSTALVALFLLCVCQTVSAASIKVKHACSDMGTITVSTYDNKDGVNMIAHQSKTVEHGKSVTLSKHLKNNHKYKVSLSGGCVVSGKSDGHVIVTGSALSDTKKIACAMTTLQYVQTGITLKDIEAKDDPLLIECKNS